MATTYGYARISTRTQNIERQIRNIKAEYPDAHILQEAYTGTKTEGRKEWAKLYKAVEAGDTIVFDGVSRMSRDSKEGTALYFDLYEKGVTLVFLKEHHIDTTAYKEAMEASGIKVDTDDTAEGTLVKDLMTAINKFMEAKVKADIVKAFDQAEKEVTDLHERTKEGMLTAKLNGKRIGTEAGRKLNIKKEGPAKKMIAKLSKEFDGSMDDISVMAHIEESGLSISRPTYYKYKKELRDDRLRNDRLVAYAEALKG